MTIINDRRDNDNWLESTFDQISDFELEEEMKKRKKKNPDSIVVPVYGVYAEFSCPKCGYGKDVEMEEFNDDGTIEITCFDCDCEYIVDLEEN